MGWGGGLTYLVLRTWFIATLLRSLGSFTTLHVATLLMGWGGGVGDVHVPADGVGWGGGGCSRTLYFVHDPLLRCWDLWDRLLRYMLLRCWWGGVGGWGMFTYLVLRTWSIATLLRSLGSFTTLHVATLLMGWGGGVGDVHVPADGVGWGGGGCSRTLYFVHDPLLRCWDLWDRLLRYMLLRCWWGGVGGWGMFTYLVLRTWSIATLLRSLGSFTTLHVATLLMGWGGGVGDVHVPCTSYMIHCYAAEISGIVYYVTCCYAADGCKAFIPKQLGSQSELIEVYLRAFQWRYINRLTLIRTKTIHQLNLLRKWRRKQSAQSVFW